MGSHWHPRQQPPPLPLPPPPPPPPSQSHPPIYDFTARNISMNSHAPFSYHPRPFNGGTDSPVAVPPPSAPASAMAPPPMTSDPDFDILEWHPAYTSCQRYFLDHAQHEPATQALCALINIRLPFQSPSNPITSSTPSQNAAPAATGSSGSAFSFNPFPRTASSMNSPNRPPPASNPSPPVFVSLVPYIRRLVVTAFDKPPILHGFFGDDYVRGVMPHVDCERRNYLFAAKHGGWRTCKRQYDSGSGAGDESVPFMKPLDEARMEELTAAEKSWSSWLAMEDWMVGPRAPADDGASMNSNGAGRSGFGYGMNTRENLPDGFGGHMHDTTEVGFESH
ncbi:hypothetical protein NU219Hw_g8166t1 [Hortaea werneckii]